MIKDHMITRLVAEPALTGLDEGDLLQLLQVMEEVTLPKDKVLTWEETPVREFGVILAGSLGVFNGADRTGELGAGALFGVEELNGDRCWRRTLVTEAETRVLVSGWGQLKNLTEMNPHFASFFGMAPASVTPITVASRFNLRARARSLAFG